MAVTKSSKKKVKVSKNRKKAWNKYCDIKEVEDFLEEKRFEERIGGKVSEKKDNELFFVQTGQEQPSALAKKINKPLRCYQNIASFSDVKPPVDVNVNRYPKRIKNEIEKKKEKESKKLVNEPVKEKKPAKSNHGRTISFDKDIWAEEDKEENDFVKEIKFFRDEYTKTRTPKVPSHRYQKPSLLPSVEVPHAGTSYNPSFEDHQELLKEAVSVEEKKLKQELHLKRVLDNMFPSKKDAPSEASILAEMSQGLFEDEEEVEQLENPNNFMLRNPPVCAEDRLTRSRKRKRKELKEEAKRRVQEKMNKRRIHEIYRIPSIKKEIKKEEQISLKKQQKKIKEKTEKLFKPKTLSKYKYETPDLEVNLTEEITGSLRTLKTDGNILEDRYKSLQRRNIIEPRIKQKFKRKYKLKKQIKRSHREC